jgi:hypothetical protein
MRADSAAYNSRSSLASEGCVAIRIYSKWSSALLKLSPVTRLAAADVSGLQLQGGIASFFVPDSYGVVHSR